MKNIFVFVSIVFSWFALSTGTVHAQADETPGYMKPFGIELGKPFVGGENVVLKREFDNKTIFYLSTYPKPVSLMSRPCNPGNASIYRAKTADGCNATVWVNKFDKRVFAVWLISQGSGVNVRHYAVGLKDQLLQKYPELTCTFPIPGDPETCMHKNTVWKDRDYLKDILITSAKHPGFTITMTTDNELDTISLHFKDTHIHETDGKVLTDTQTKMDSDAF